MTRLGQWVPGGLVGCLGRSGRHESRPGCCFWARNGAKRLQRGRWAEMTVGHEVHVVQWTMTTHKEGGTHTQAGQPVSATLHRPSSPRPPGQLLRRWMRPAPVRPAAGRAPTEAAAPSPARRRRQSTAAPRHAPPDQTSVPGPRPAHPTTPDTHTAPRQLSYGKQTTL